MATDLPTLTGALEAGRDLSAPEAGAAAHAMIDAGVTDEAKAAFLLALARRGETAVEVAAFAHAYRERARVVDFGDVPARAIDIVGTGGDRSGSFNISSASSLIVAAAGVPVLKHGNRSITSKSGSADFLAGLGVALEATGGLEHLAERAADGVGGVVHKQMGVVGTPRESRPAAGPTIQPGYVELRRA